jgi:tetratricopeptide (TPR) repeat protein
MNESIPSSPTSEQAELWGKLIEGLLETVPEAQRHAIRVGAIPHRVDETMLARLAGIEGRAALELLEPFRFARRGLYGSYIYRDEIRSYLLGWWQQHAPEEYRQINRAWYAYFLELAAQASPFERTAAEREALYHLLAFDESASLRGFNDQIEQASLAYRRSTVEQLAKLAGELEAHLSNAGKDWIRYFNATLDWVYRSKDLGKGAFKKLMDETHDDVLQPLAGWKLGMVYVHQQQWTEALRLYLRSLKALAAKGEIHSRARVLLFLAEAYCDLADKSGGFLDEVTESFGRASDMLRKAEHLPFLIYQWFVHRIDFLPNWYFGTSYQDWIIAYLYSTGAGYYRQAERDFVEVMDLEGVAQARLALARLDHILGRWSRAQKRFAELLSMEAIHKSHYLTARVRLEQGQAYLREGRLGPAIEALTQVADTFERFEDGPNAGEAYASLGQSYARAGRSTDASEAFLKSASFLQAAGEHMAVTQVIWGLERLLTNGAGRPLPAEQRERVVACLKGIPERETLSRFPQKILGWFRKIALLGALPLTYLLVVVLSAAISISFIILEATVVSTFIGVDLRILDLGDILILLAWGLLPLPLAFWLYELIYSGMGWVIVRILGRRLAPIEQEQPAQIRVDDRTVSRVTSGETGNWSLDWKEIRGLASVDYKIWRQPIQLISSTLLLSENPPAAIEGTVAGYLRLKENLHQRLGREASPDGGLGWPPRISSYDFTFLDRRWTLVVLALVAGLGVLFMLFGAAEISGGFDGGEDLRLPFSTTLAITLINLLFFLPACILIRLSRHRRELRRDFGYLGATLSTRTIDVAAGLVVLLSLIWLVLLLLTTASMQAGKLFPPAIIFS